MHVFHDVAYAIALILLPFMVGPPSLASIAGLYIVLAKPERLSKLVDSWRRRASARYESCRGSSFARRYLERSLLWPFATTASFAGGVKNQHYGAGLWVLCAGWSVGLESLLLTVVAEIILGLVEVVVALAIIWLVFKLLSNSDSREETSENVTWAPSGGTSREKTGLFGQAYTQHCDAAGTIVGKSEEREELFGATYTEHRDADGNITGESRDREGLFGGRYTEHRDAEGDVVGESEDKVGVANERYTERYDADGNVVGESREQEGILGDKYIKHD